MPAENKTPLEVFVEPLEKLEYFAAHEPVGEGESVYEKLYVSLKVDDVHPEREYGLEIFFINDVTEAFGDEEQDEDAIIAQFMLILPFGIPVEAYVETIRYCNLINRLLPLGAFGLSEQDGAVYLRYCLASESRAIPVDVLVETVTALEYACKEYAPHFDDLSTGIKTFEDEVREFEEAGLQIPSVGDPELLAAG